MMNMEIPEWVSDGINRQLFHSRLALQRNGDLEAAQRQVQAAHETLISLKQYAGASLTREALEHFHFISYHPHLAAESALHQLTLTIFALQESLTHVLEGSVPWQEALKLLTTQFQSQRRQAGVQDYNQFFANISDHVVPVDTFRLNQLDEAGYTDLTKKIRQKFQLCLAAAIRGIQREAQLTAISKLFSTLHTLCQQTPIALLWDAALQLSRGIENNSIPLDSEVLDTLKALENELRKMCEEGPARVNAPPDGQLLRRILYYVGQAQTEHLALVASHSSTDAEEAPTQHTHKDDINCIPQTRFTYLQKMIVELSDGLTEFRNDRNLQTESLIELADYCAEFSQDLVLGQHETLRVIVNQISINLRKLARIHQQDPFDAHNNDITMTALTNAISLLENNLLRLQDDPVLNQPAVTRPRLYGSDTSAEHQNDKHSLSPRIMAEQSKIIHDPVTPEQLAQRREQTQPLKTEFVQKIQQELAAQPAPTTSKPEAPKSSDERAVKSVLTQPLSPAVELSFVEMAQTLSSQLSHNIPLLHEPNYVRADSEHLLALLHKFEVLCDHEGAKVIAALLHALANIAQTVLPQQRRFNEGELSIIERAISMLPELINDVKNDCQLLTPEVLLLMEQADALTSEQLLDDADDDSAEAVDDSSINEPARLFGKAIEVEAPTTSVASNSVHEPTVEPVHNSQPSNSTEPFNNDMADTLIEYVDDLASIQMQLTYQSNNTRRLADEMQDTIARLKEITKPLTESPNTRTVLLEQLARVTELRASMQNAINAQENLLTQQASNYHYLTQSLLATRLVPLERFALQLSDCCEPLPVILDVAPMSGEMDKKVLEPAVHALCSTVSQLSQRGLTGHLKLSVRNVEQHTEVRLELDKEQLQLVHSMDFTDEGFSAAAQPLIALGGFIEIKPSFNDEADLVLRLPTIANNFRAYIVADGAARYAIACHSVSQLAMIPSQLLTDSYRNRSALEFEGVTANHLVYLGNITDNKKPALDKAGYPVLFVNQGNSSVAIQVDAIVEDRVIRTKELGSQFDAVAEVTGGTIMDDSRVILILNPSMLYQQYISSGPHDDLIEVSEQSQILPDFDVNILD